MAAVYRHWHGEAFAADLRPDVSVSLELLTGCDYAVLKFEDSDDLFRVIVPLHVLPRLVTVISGAGLDGQRRE